MYRIRPLKGFQVLSKELSSRITESYYDQAYLNSKLLTQGILEIKPATKQLAVLRTKNAYLRVLAGDRMRPYSWIYSSPLTDKGSLLFELNKTKEIHSVVELQKGLETLKNSFKELEQALNSGVFSMDICKKVSNWLYKLINRDKLWGHLGPDAEYSLKYVRRIGNAYSSALLISSISKNARSKIVFCKTHYVAVSHNHFYTEKFRTAFPEIASIKVSKKPPEETKTPSGQIPSISQISQECFQEAYSLLKRVNRELQTHNSHFHQKIKTSSSPSSAQASQDPSSLK